MTRFADESETDQQREQRVIQAARQYEPDNDLLVEAGSAEETAMSLPIAYAILAEHEGDEPQ